MSLDVDRILAQRAGRAGRAPEATSVAAALLLHALVLGGAFLLPRLSPPPPPLNFVPVQIIPAQALGVRRPAPPRQAQPPAPKPVEEPAPEPVAEPALEPEPEPEPPTPKEEAPVLPDPKPDKKPEKKPEPKKPAPASASPKATPKPGKADPEPKPPAKASDKPAGTATGETGDQLGRRGGAQGNPLGTTAFGSEIAGIDNPDFTFGYYLDRLLSLIDGQWQRPNMGSGVKTVLSFRIERDGTLSDLRVAESSGYNSFDLAAMRAVQNASPFPPLPRAYRHDSLGVNLIVR